MTAAIEDGDQAARACADARMVYGCVGMDYRGWPERWPPLMAGMLEGAQSAGAPFVFADNLYMYGPVDEPMHEEMPLTDYGKKPATRAKITRMWQEANAEGRVRVTALRASDFFGPRVTMSMLGEMVASPAVSGGTANLVGDPAQLHSFSYVPDFARGLVTLGEAGDEVAGEVFNLPNAPAQSVASVVESMYRTAGSEPKIRTTPDWMLSALGLFNTNIRELKEMLYQWQRPFVVDHSKFAGRFWDDPTPIEAGVEETMDWYASRA
jgi:nucleoside-diphosphate-sugar epimerase